MNRWTNIIEPGEVAQSVNDRSNENRGGAVVQGYYARDDKILRVGAQSAATGRVVGVSKKILAQVSVLIIHEIPGYTEAK